MENTITPITPKTTNRLLYPVNLLLVILLPPIGLLVGAWVFLRSNNKRSPKLILLLVLSLLLTVAYGYYFLAFFNGQTPHHQSYKVSELSTTKFDNSQKGQTMTFDIPKQFVKTLEVDHATRFSQVITDSISHKQLTVGTIEVASVPKDFKYTLAPGLATALAAIGQYIDKEKTQSGQSPKELGLKNQSGQSPTKVTISHPAVFTNTNIKFNAWQVDVTSTSSTDKLVFNNPNQQFKGKFVYVLTEQAKYYFYVSTVGYNWSVNSPTWDAVLASLKVDQQ